MELRVAVFQDPDRAGLGPNECRWIARSLAYDFTGESTTREGAVRNLLGAIVAEYAAAERDGRRPFEGLPRTPERFVRWWQEQTRERLEIPQEVTKALPEAWMIDAMEQAARQSRSSLPK